MGKSTLLNAILGEKIAIVAKKPQTTRTRITGILTKGESQFVFLDTPGMIKSRNKLGKLKLTYLSFSADAHCDNEQNIYDYCA